MRLRMKSSSVKYPASSRTSWGSETRHQRRSLSPALTRGLILLCIALGLVAVFGPKNLYQSQSRNNEASFASSTLVEDVHKALDAAGADTNTSRSGEDATEESGEVPQAPLSEADIQQPATADNSTSEDSVKPDEVSKDEQVGDSSDARCDVLPPVPDGAPPKDPFCGPSILIGGAMKCGTNAIGQLITAHPRVVVNRCNIDDGAEVCSPRTAQGANRSDIVWEQHIFTHRLREVATKKNIPIAEAIYSEEFAKVLRTMFPNLRPGSGKVSIEKAPSHLDTHMLPEVPALMKKYLPHLHVVFVLCEPVQRIWSEYNHWKRYPGSIVESLDACGLTTFDAAVNAALKGTEPNCSAVSALKKLIEKGKYANHIRLWREHFGAQVHVVYPEHFHGDSGKTVAQSLFESIGLPPQEFDWTEAWEAWGSKQHFHNKQVDGYDRSLVPAGVASQLRDEYRESTEAMANELNFQPAKEWLEADSN